MSQYNITEKDYLLWNNRIIDSLKEIRGVTHVQRFGETRCPGVSDLDFWVFYDPELDGTMLEKKIRSLQSESPISIDYRPIPASLAQYLPYFIPSITEHLPASLPDLDILSPEATQQLAYTFILIWLPSKIASASRSQHIDDVTTSSLRTLYSFRYTLEQMAIANLLPASAAHQFTESATRIRNCHINNILNRNDLNRTYNNLFGLISAALSKELPPYIRPKVDIKNDLWLPVDWCTFLRFSNNGKLHIQQHIKNPAILRTHSLTPVTITLPYQWSGTLAYYYSNTTLAKHLPYLSSAPSPPVTISQHLHKQSQLFSEFITSFKLQKLRKGAIISPLIKKHPHFIAKSIAQMARVK
jgi:hypothetical protein